MKKFKKVDILKVTVQISFIVTHYIDTYLNIFVAFSKITFNAT